MARRTLLSRIILSPLNRFTRRFHLSFRQSRDITDSRLGFVLSTSTVMSDWSLATGTGKSSLMISAAILLGYWSVTLDVTV